MQISIRHGIPAVILLWDEQCSAADITTTCFMATYLILKKKKNRHNGWRCSLFMCGCAAGLEGWNKLCSRLFGAMCPNHLHLCIQMKLRTLLWRCETETYKNCANFAVSHNTRSSYYMCVYGKNESKTTTIKIKSQHAFVYFLNIWLQQFIIWIKKNNFRYY
jgi:hypothetical protein